MRDIQPLIEYIQQNRAEGVSDEVIRGTLLQGGSWSEEEVLSELNFNNDLSEAIAAPSIPTTETSKKLLVTTAIIAGLLLIAGITYFVTKETNLVPATPLVPTETSTSTLDLLQAQQTPIATTTEVVPNKIQASTSSIPEETQTVPKETLPSTVTPAPVVQAPASTNQDCGTLEVVDLFSETPSKQAEEDLGCLNSSIINCTPASTKIIGTGESILKVHGKEGNSCMIEQIVLERGEGPSGPSDFEYYTICKFPRETFTTPLVDSLEKAGSTRLLFMGLGFVKSDNDATADADGWFLNTWTSIAGEVTYKCK